MKLTNCLLLFISVLSFSCTNKHHQDTKSDEFENFKIKKNVTFKMEDCFFGSTVEIAVVDTFLIRSDLRDTAVIHVYGLKSKQKITSFLKRGAEENECLSFSDITPTDDNGIFWGYDITLRKLFKIDLFKAIANPKYVPEEIIHLERTLIGTKGAVWAGSDKFIASSYFLRDSRLFMFDKKSKKIGRIGNLPNLIKTKYEENLKEFLSVGAMTYPIIFKYNRMQKTAFVAYFSTPRIEIYNKDTLTKVINGPDLFLPDYDFRRDGDAIAPFTTNSTKFAFVNMSVTKNYVILLYSGQSEQQTCASKIYIFDWKGNPIADLNAAETYCKITALEKEKGLELFSIDRSTKKLTSTYINLP